MARSSLATAELWRQRLTQFNYSDLTVHAFCRSVRCSIPTFYYWKRKLGLIRKASAAANRKTSAAPMATRSRPQGGSPSAFIPVLVRSSGAVITLADGTRIELQCDPAVVLESVLRQAQRGG